MSHETTTPGVGQNITDIDAFELACTELGVELIKARSRTGYGRRKHACAYKICLPANDQRDAYEAGLTKNADGSYALSMDNYSYRNVLPEVIGRDASRLLPEYAAQVAKREFQRKGYTRFRREERTVDGRKRPAIVALG